MPANFEGKTGFDLKLPKYFKHLINQESYSWIITKALEHLEQTGHEIVNVSDGRITVKENTSKNGKIISLDNIVRYVAMMNREDWPGGIIELLDRSSMDINAHNFFLKDYEHAGKLLKVLLKPASFLQAAGPGRFVHKVHFPGTVSVLVLNFKGQFWFLKEENIKEWNVSEDELFKRALANIEMEKSSMSCMVLGSGINIYMFWGNDFCAARMIEPEKNAPAVVCKTGTILGIPSKGVVFATPFRNINNTEKLMHAIGVVTEKAFQVELSPIVPDLYWYFEGKFYKLGKENNTSQSVPDSSTINL